MSRSVLVLCGLLAASSLGTAHAWSPAEGSFHLETPVLEAGLSYAEARAGRRAIEDLPPEETNAPDPQAQMRQLRLRRKIMNAHETLALITWGMMTANMVFASMNHAWRVGAVNMTRHNQRFYTDTVPKIHRVLAYGGAGVYLTTGLLAWTAPKAVSVDALPGAQALASKHKDSGKIHRKLSYMHAAGMGIMILNGILTSKVIGPNVDTNTYNGFITTHLAIGYVTYALLTAAGLIILFS